MKVYKYPLSTHEENDIVLPVGSTVLHVHNQENVPCLWVQISEAEKTECRTFCCFVTGVDFDGGRYHGTCHLFEGKFVVHVFEVIKTTT